MVGHYLLTLTPEQEDRVLTSRLVGGAFFARGGRCLIATVRDFRYNADVRQGAIPLRESIPGIRFDMACRRFGEPRVNAAIRNRILANRARRVLTAVRESVAA